MIDYYFTQRIIMKSLNVTFIPNGPMRFNIETDGVENDLFFDHQAQSIPVTGNLFLCRCGQSKKQPYCDGTHKKVGFSDQKEIEQEIIQQYDGLEISVTFNRSICSGAARCVEEYGHIYDSSSSTNWIFPNSGTIEEIIKSVHNCPTGALSYKINDKRVFEEYGKVSLQIVEKGPLNVKGCVDLGSVKFSKYANKQKFALCRCGASKNKPFCDYSHASLEGEEYTF